MVDFFNYLHALGNRLADGNPQSHLAEGTNSLAVDSEGHVIEDSSSSAPNHVAEGGNNSLAVIDTTEGNALVETDPSSATQIIGESGQSSATQVIEKQEKIREKLKDKKPTQAKGETEALLSAKDLEQLHQIAETLHGLRELTGQIAAKDLQQLQQIVEKSPAIYESREATHKAHKRQHFTKGMFLDSVIVKASVLPVVFGISLGFSAFAPEAFSTLAVVFVGLGTHLSYQATSSFLKLIGKAPRALQTPKKKKNPGRTAVEDFVSYRKRIDALTTFEISLGLVASIHTMPLLAQTGIMAFSAIVMTVAPPLLTNFLLFVEEKGLQGAKKIRNIKPTTALKKLVIGKNLRPRLANLLEDTTTRMFDVMPGVGAFFKALTGGRVFAFGVGPIEALFKEHARGMLEKDLAWLGTGIAVGAAGVTATVTYKKVKPIAKPSFVALCIDRVSPPPKLPQHVASHFVREHSPVPGLSYMDERIKPLVSPPAGAPVVFEAVRPKGLLAQNRALVAALT